MKRTAKILTFTLTLALVTAAMIVVPGVAADDIQDFIGKAEQLAYDEQAKEVEPPISGEQPSFRPAVGRIQGYSSVGGYVDYLEGERLETRFDVAPALQGGGTIPRLQVASISTQPVQEENSQAQHTAEEIEPVPISEFIPPPNTGRDSYLIWGVLGGAILLGGALPALRKRARRR